MSSIDETILDAIHLLIQAELKNLKKDNIFFAKVVSCENQQKGYYKCKYQDIYVYAYASYPLMKFQTGDDVYILDAAADEYNNSKIILGKRYV